MGKLKVVTDTSREFSIERGIPLPKNKGKPSSSPLTLTMQKMQIGDSFFVPLNGRTQATLASVLIKPRNIAGKFKTRTRVEDGVEGRRVWRVA